MVKRVYLFAPWIRHWHWANAVTILALIVTGISLHYADTKGMLVPFDLSRDVHNIAGIVLCAIYGFFLIANIVSGNWLQYVPSGPNYGKRLWIQARFYLWDCFFGRPHPHHPSVKRNFNDLQQIVYWAVMYVLMPLLLISGLLFLWPELAPDRIMGVDGLLPVAIAHYIFGYMISLFMLGHMYLSTMGDTPTTSLKTMLTGWYQSPEKGQILLIDDEYTTVKAETKRLEDLGYSVTPRTSSIEGLEAFKADPDKFDLVITDFTMPNLMGDELAKQILELRPDLPVILCRGESEDIGGEGAEAEGVQAYVLKPVFDGEIDPTIQRVLDRGK